MADLKPISQFATASSVEANTLLFVSTPNQNNGYDSEKVSASELGEALVNDFEYTQDLQTTDKTVVGAINELNTVLSGTDITSDVTLNSDISLVQGQIYKIGSLITINAVLKANQSIPNNASIWTGLPMAKGNYRFSKGTSDGVYYATEWTGGGLFIDNNSNGLGNFTVITANKYIFVNCSYITSE